MNLLVTMFLREECYMLPDYEIKRATSIGQKVDAVILFVWTLLVIQMVLFLLFQGTDQADGTRIRLIGNSNTAYDQQVKMEVKEIIAPILANYYTNAEETMKELEKTVETLSETYNEQITISQGQALFPPKEWQGGILPQTNVESIVISIGKARGDNWWCALFPKVCYKEEVKEEKPKFWVWEWVKKKFST